MAQKIAILGGTFNPVHNGHLHLACAVNDYCHFDHVLVIPTNLPPHKQTCDLVSNEHRFEMCRLAFKGIPGFEVSDIEFRLAGKSYTVRTLQQLRKYYPNAEFYLLMGSDMFLSFHLWYRYQDILDMSKIIAIARNSGEYSLLKAQEKRHEEYEGRVKILDFPTVSISSTQIREAIRNHQSVSGLLPSEVLEYIKKNHLFEGEGYRTSN